MDRLRLREARATGNCSGGWRRGWTACARRIGRDRGDLLLVAHGGSLCAAIVHLLELPAASMWRFRLDNGGLSAVTLYDDGGAALDLLNDTSHLGPGPLESKE